MNTAKFHYALLFTMAICAAATPCNAQLSAAFTGIASANMVVLPMDVKFTAAVNNNSSAISWDAVKAIAVRRYELEKSTDGENFNYLTAMPGKASTYSYEDAGATNMPSYYRLKIVTSNGNCRYSKVIAVNTKAVTASLKVMPAQIDHQLYIWLPINTSVNNAVITDASGRTVATPSVTNMTNLADVFVGNLKAGIYSVRVSTNKGEIVHLKFTKTN